MKASILIGPTVVPGTADWIGRYLCADAATGSLYDIVSDFIIQKTYKLEIENNVAKHINNERIFKASRPDENAFKG